jgi:carbon monoxide dehydrogenase subunit G
VIVEGSYSFPAKREVIWELLLDPEVIAKTMPGATEMVRVSHEEYAGKLRIGIGAITAAEFQVSVVLADVVAPEHYTMLIDGQGKFGFTRGTAQVRLATDGAAGTQLAFRADMQVGGKIAAVGQRLLDSVSKLLTRQGLEALAREVTQRLQQSSVPTAPAVEPLPGEAAP